MLIFAIIILMIVFLDMKTAPKNEFYPDYISKQQTSAINGIFTLLIFISHISGYFELNGALDAPYAVMKSYLRQMVVVSFLFYSGYGIMESIKRKGMEYVKTIPTKRFFKVLYHMQLAVVLFILMNIILKKPMKPLNVVLAFTGWTSLGNSNWYIFAVLALYLIVFVSFMVSRGNKYAGVILTAVLTCVLAVVLKITDRDTWWYNTIVLFPTGMIFSLIKEKFDSIVTKSDGAWFASLAGIFALYAVFQPLRDKHLSFYYLWGIMFMMLIVMLTMKLKIGNGILNYIGSHVFSIYMLQRIPMIILDKIGMSQSHKYAYVVYCFIITLILSYAFDFVTAKLDEKIFKKPKRGEIKAA